jgi:hydrogenase/urease accessory protein HupE
VASYQYQFTYVCPDGMDELEIGYSLMFSRWSEHENFVRVFMAGQRQRMRYTSEQQTLTVPVASLLARWGQPLQPGFFDSDPHRVFSADISDPDAPLPKVVQAAPSLGTLDLAQIDPGFIRLGVAHIFGGFDHVLFVVGLVLLNRTWRRLLVLVTAFTLAHSATMALSTLGLVDIPVALAEPLIAASIVYIGLENLWALRRSGAADADTGSRSALLRRAALVFVFGLVHGVGFSYTLRQMGLREDLLGSLLYFNLGVELGQLAVVACVVPALWAVGRLVAVNKVSAGLSTAVVVAGAMMMVGRL